MPIQSISRDVPSWKPCCPVDFRFLVEEPIADIGIPLDIFRFLRIQGFFGFWSLQTSLMFIVGDVAVAVDVNDR